MGTRHATRTARTHPSATRGRTERDGRNEDVHVVVVVGRRDGPWRCEGTCRAWLDVRPRLPRGRVASCPSLRSASMHVFEWNDHRHVDAKRAHAHAIRPSRRLRNVLPSQPCFPLLPLPRRIHNPVYLSLVPPSNSQLSVSLPGATVAFTTVFCTPLRIRMVGHRSRWVRTRRGSLSSLSIPSDRTRTDSLSTPRATSRPYSTPPVPFVPCSAVESGRIRSDSCVWRRRSPRTCMARRWDVPTCVRSEPCRSTT